MCGVIDNGFCEPADAVRGSQLVVLATPVLAIVDLIGRLGPSLPATTLLTDVGSTKAAVVEQALKVFGKNAGKRFLAGHPMAGKENSGVDYADADLFQNAVWFLTPLPGQNLNDGLFAEFAGWIDQIGARIAMLPAADHDRLCAWISHLPQMISTALAAALVADFGESLFDVARYCHQQQEEYRRCAIQGGAATGAHPGESGYAGASGGV